MLSWPLLPESHGNQCVTEMDDRQEPQATRIGHITVTATRAQECASGLTDSYIADGTRTAICGRALTHVNRAGAGYSLRLLTISVIALRFASQH